MLLQFLSGDWLYSVATMKSVINVEGLCWLLNIHKRAHTHTQSPVASYQITACLFVSIAYLINFVITNGLIIVNGEAYAYMGLSAQF